MKLKLSILESKEKKGWKTVLIEEFEKPHLWFEHLKRIDDDYELFFEWDDHKGYAAQMTLRQVVLEVRLTGPTIFYELTRNTWKPDRSEWKIEEPILKAKLEEVVKLLDNWIMKTRQPRLSRWQQVRA